MKDIQLLRGLLLPLVVFCLVAVSCGRDAVPVTVGGTAMCFRGEHEGVSRTTGGGEAWTATDEVGIFLVRPGMDLVDGVVAGASNVKYLVEPDERDPSVATFRPSTPSGTIYFPGEAVDVVAYYPWRSSGGEGDTLLLSVTGQSDPGAIDVLRALTAGIDKAYGEVSLLFEHVMSKMVLNVRAGAGMNADDISASGTTATISGVPGSATVRLQDGALTPGELASRPIKLYREAVAAKGSAATFSAILVPGGGGRDRSVEFTVNGSTYTWEIPETIAFPAGTCYTYTVCIERTGVTVGDMTITPWGSINAPETDTLREAGIYTAADLEEFSKDWNDAWGNSEAKKRVIEKWSGAPDGVVCLRADIDMVEVKNFTPIGKEYRNRFTGQFDGRGHAISNLKVSVTGDNAGLFGANGGTIRDVVLERCEVEASGDNSGGIAGRSNGTIAGCTVTNGTVTADRWGGGICGDAYGTITSCTVTGGTVTANNDDAGGICGYINSAAIIDACQVSGATVKANNDDAGGIGGRSSGTIKNCIVTNGTVKANNDHAGGIGGWSSGTIKNCIVTNGTVTATGNYAGGVCGSVSQGTVGGCIATGVAVEANDYAGGICGGVHRGGTIVGCIGVPSRVTGGNKIGVCVGTNSGSTIMACYGVIVGGLGNVGLDNGTSECTSFNATDVKETDNFFMTGSDGEKPIEKMNKALESKGLGVRWTEGNAESGWYPVAGNLEM